MKSRTIAVSFAITFALSGCSFNQPDLSGNLNVIEDRTETVVVDFLPRTSMMDNESIDILKEEAGAGSVQSVTVYAPPARSRLSGERLATLQKKLVALGVPRGSISIAHKSYDDDSMDDSIETEIKSSGLRLADCDVQRNQPFDYYMNYPSRSFGCVNNHNLGAMIVDKNDMIKGTGQVGSDANNAAAAIVNYRAGFAASSGESSEGSSSGGSEGASTGSSGGK